MNDAESRVLATLRSVHDIARWQQRERADRRFRGVFADRQVPSPQNCSSLGFLERATNASWLYARLIAGNDLAKNGEYISGPGRTIETGKKIFSPLFSPLDDDLRYRTSH